MIYLFITKSKHEILRYILFIVLGLSIGATIHFNPFFKTFSKGINDELIVVVDAGHGLPDGGAVGTGGTVEQEINLAVSKKLFEVLQGKGIKVIMTRKDENCLAEIVENKSIRTLKVEDMNKRLELIKSSGANLFVSIHMNYFSSSKAEGLRLFYDKNHPEAKVLAQNIQQKMSEVTGAKMYAVKTADQSLFLMKSPPIPSVLVECGFLSNIDEEKKLNDEDYQSRIAWAIADAIEKYYKDLQ